jgi:hypothetical protein
MKAGPAVIGQSVRSMADRLAGDVQINQEAYDSVVANDRVFHLFAPSTLNVLGYLLMCETTPSSRVRARCAPPLLP